MEQSSEFIPAMKCSVVIAECEKQFGLPRGTLKEKTKLKHVVQIRHIAVLLCRKITGRSYPQIAIAVGYRDHTTCLYACKVAPKLLERNADLAAKAKAVEDALNA